MSSTVTRYAIGSTVVKAPFELATSTADYLIADANEVGGFRKVPAMVHPTQVNRWQAEIAPDVETQLLYTYAEDGVLRLSALPQRDQARLYAYFGTTTIEPVPVDAAFDFNVTLDRAYAAGDTFLWYTTGAWAQRGFLAADLPAIGGTAIVPPAAIPFQAGAPLTSNGKLQRLLRSDALLVMRRNAGKLTGLLEAEPFDMAGGPNPVTGTMKAVVDDLAMAATFDSTGTAGRLANVLPAYPTFSLQWGISASPAGGDGFVGGPLLASGAVVANTGDVAVIASYGNPFTARAWPATLNWQAAATRAYQPAGGLPPITLVTRFNTVAPVPTDNSTFGAPAGLPTSIAVQGATLISDGLVVTLDRTKPVTVSFVVDTINADLYRFTLIEVVSDGVAATVAARFDAVGRVPTWSVPADAFVAGKTYFIRANATLGGTPGVANGDLVERGLPAHSATTDSGVFTVAP